MNDKILNLLGICRRAGRLTPGNDMVIEAMKDGSARLVVTASDISKNTESKILSACQQTGTPHLSLDKTRDEMSRALGRLCVVAAVCDSGFANKLSELCNK